jgi:hypothetical protein
MRLLVLLPDDDLCMRHIFTLDMYDLCMRHIYIFTFDSLYY